MNQVNYQLLFTVSVSHSFFKDKIDRSFLFQPFESTKELANRFKIMFKTFPGGIHVFGGTEESIESFLEMILASTEISFLAFDLYSNDPSFYNYSDLPLGRVFQLIYSSDNELNQIDNGTIVLYPSFIERQNENRLGELRIHLQDLLNFSNSSSSSPFDYYISFDSRSTQWCYYFVNSSQISSDGFYIYNDSGIKFYDPVEVTMPDGSIASRFSSRELIPLSEAPKYKFSLLSNDGRLLIEDLPNPNHRTISVQENNGEKWAMSSVYVYL